MINLTTEILREKINHLVAHGVIVNTFVPEGSTENSPLGYEIDRIKIWKHEVAGELYYLMSVYGFDFVNDAVLDLCPAYEDLKNVVNTQNESLVDAYFSQQ